VPPDERPPFGTYWEVRNSLPCLAVPLPFPPAGTNLAVYDLGGGRFLVDETAGPLVAPLPSAYAHRTLSAADYAAIIQAWSKQPAIPSSVPSQWGWNFTDSRLGTPMGVLEAWSNDQLIG
jgi:hypothetical protein